MYSSLNKFIKIISVLICLIFVVQMGFDVVVKFKKVQDEEVVCDGEDETEKEADKEIEDQKEESLKNITSFQYLSFQKQNKSNTIARQRSKQNLPIIFISKFTPPPEKLIL